jgi:hypothetical protein
MFIAVSLAVSVGLGYPVTFLAGGWAYRRWSERESRGSHTDYERADVTPSAIRSRIQHEQQQAEKPSRHVDMAQTGPIDTDPPPSRRYFDQLHQSAERRERAALRTG